MTMLTSELVSAIPKLILIMIGVIFSLVRYKQNQEVSKFILISMSLMSISIVGGVVFRFYLVGTLNSNLGPEISMEKITIINFILVMLNATGFGLLLYTAFYKRK